ncbi:hypothetical protein ACFO8O_14740 [Hephaestia sp. GCM10023244]|uniref:hypothetical protein n=1 Tax=unclassified Hephaestia TaxID=2631281 RepID=UPI0020777F5C|nr:hypothetical protein [Hephaestia sp. MAHUQ-44]MCM8732218.1 hypothetical protein [Hephaestia sp. MAHUQ-44]
MASDDDAVARRPWHLWAVGVLSLIWNAGGAVDYVMTKTHNAAYLANFTPEQLAWFDSFPPVMTVAWAVGVWGAVLGSLLLLLANRWAVWAFTASLAGLVIGTVYQFGVSAMPASLNTPAGMAFTAALWIGAVLLLWYAIRMRACGVLR